MYEFVSKCDCGAITVSIKGLDYSMPRKLFNDLFNGKGKRIFHRNCNCNYCVNHWGIDLCSCGSGEKYQKCKEGHSVCGNPMQNIENYQINVNGGW